MNILGIAGSLRKGSFNKAILRAAVELAPKGVNIEVFDLEGIPPFNQDLEDSPPQIVNDLKKKARAADAVLFATPENNYSVPAALSNAIAWATRPYGDNAFEGKPVGIMSASVGMLGGARAQYHLRQMCVFLNMHPLNRPEIMVPVADKKVDASGNLVDQETRKRIAELVAALVAWATLTTVTTRTSSSTA